MRPEVNNLVSHNLATWGKVSTQLDTKNIDTSRRICFPLFLSPSACYKYFNEQVHREWEKGKRAETMECGLYIGMYCPPISRHLAHFPPFFREAGPCHARPPACVGIIVVLLRRPLHFRFVARRSGARIDASRCISCVRARAAGVLDSYRDARDCSSLRSLVWVDSRHVSQNSVHFRRAWWCERSSQKLFSAAFYFITFNGIKYCNEKVRKEGCRVQLKRKKSHWWFEVTFCDKLICRGVKLILKDNKNLKITHKN